MVSQSGSFCVSNCLPPEWNASPPASGASGCNRSKLESGSPGATITRLVAPGDPLSSLLLIHPLAPEAGGDAFHPRARPFEPQNDPDWLTIADWVRRAH